METILILAVSAIVVLLFWLLNLQRQIQLLQKTAELQQKVNDSVVAFQNNQSQVVNQSVANAIMVIAQEVDKLTKKALK